MTNLQAQVWETPNVFPVGSLTGTHNQFIQLLICKLLRMQMNIYIHTFNVYIYPDIK